MAEQLNTLLFNWLLSRFGSGVTGGELITTRATSSSLWHAAFDGWHGTGPGGDGPASPSLAGLAVPAGNGGLVNYAARFGTASDIRDVLAAEDLEYRRKNDGRLLERLFHVSVYFKAYAPMSLDQYAELERWRAVGARNVGAPPEGAQQEK